MSATTDRIRWSIVWIILISWIGPGQGFTAAVNLTTVPLIPFQVLVEWTISSPDVLHLALVEYLEENTIAERIVLELNATVQSVDLPERFEFFYTGIAKAANDYGFMTCDVLQQEQRMMLENTIDLALFVEMCYAKAIRPFNGSCKVLGVELQSPKAPATPFSDDSMEHGGDEYSTVWFVLLVACAGVTGSAILIVLSVNCVAAQVRRWETRLQDWKYNLEREQHLMPVEELAAATMNSSSRDAIDTDTAAPTDRKETTGNAEP